VARSGPYTNFREVSARLLLAPGRYCIVPSTYEAGIEAEFSLRVLQERDWGVVRQPVIENVAVTNRDGGVDRHASVETVTVTFTRNIEYEGFFQRCFRCFNALPFLFAVATTAG